MMDEMTTETLEQRALRIAEQAGQDAVLAMLKEWNRSAQGDGIDGRELKRLVLKTEKVLDAAMHQERDRVSLAAFEAAKAANLAEQEEQSPEPAAAATTYDYTRTFNSIAAATRIEGTHLAISCAAFWCEYYAPHWIENRTVATQPPSRLDVEKSGSSGALSVSATATNICGAPSPEGLLCRGSWHHSGLHSWEDAVAIAAARAEGVLEGLEKAAKICDKTLYGKRPAAAIRAAIGGE